MKQIKNKSLWIALIALMLVLSLVACNPDQQDPETESTTPAATEQETTAETTPGNDQTTEPGSTSPDVTTSGDETTDPGATLESPTYVIKFDSEQIGKLMSGEMDKIDLSFDAQEQALRIETLVAHRPNFLIEYPIIPDVAEYPYVAIRIKTSNLESTGVFFMACAGSNYEIVYNDVWADKAMVYDFNEDWQTVILDYSDPTDGLEDGADYMYTGFSSYIRFDPWYAVDAGAVMYLNSIAFFKTAEGARAYTGVEIIEETTTEPQNIVE